jgi:hypothetical protein
MPLTSSILFLLLAIPVLGQNLYYWGWNGTTPDAQSSSNWVCLVAPSSDPNCYSASQPAQFTSSSDRVLWMPCGQFANNITVYTPTDITWPTVDTDVVGCAAIIIQPLSQLTILDALLGLQAVTFISTTSYNEYAALSYEGITVNALDLGLVDLSQSLGSFYFKSSIINIQTLLAGSITQIIFTGYNQGGPFSGLSINSATVSPTMNSQTWSLDGVGSANFSSLNINGVPQNQFVVGPYSSSDHVQIGLFGTSSVRNCGWLIQDTQSQTGPSYLDASALLNMSSGAYLSLWGAWQIAGNISGGTVNYMNPTVPITISGFLFGVNLNLYGNALINGVFSDVPVAAFQSSTNLIRTVNGYLQMSSLNSTGSITFLGGQWEVLGPLAVSAIDLINSTLLLEGSVSLSNVTYDSNSILAFDLISGGQLYLSNMQIVGNGQIQLLGGNFQLQSTNNTFQVSRIVVNGSGTLFVINRTFYTPPPLTIQNNGTVQNKGSMFIHNGISLDTGAIFDNEGILSLPSPSVSNVFVPLLGGSTFQNKGFFNVSNVTTIGNPGANNGTFANSGQLTISAILATDKFLQNGTSAELDLTPQGTLLATSIVNDASCTMNMGGSVHVNQTLFNDGVINVAGQNRTGNWSLQGDFRQYSLGVLSFEVNVFDPSGAGDFDTFSASGSVVLDGSAMITALNSNALLNINNGSWYVLVSAASLYGSFSNVTHNFGSNFQLSFCYTPTSAVLVIYHPGAVSSTLPLPANCNTFGPPAPSVPSPFTSTSSVPGSSSPFTPSTPAGGHRLSPAPITLASAHLVAMFLLIFLFLVL